MDSVNYTAPTLNDAIHVTKINVKKNLIMFTSNSRRVFFILFSTQNYSTGGHSTVKQSTTYVIHTVAYIMHCTTANNI